MTTLERLMEARAKVAAGEFDRTITDREVKALDYDLLTLACGHTVLVLAIRTDEPKHYCALCAEAWLKSEPQS
jgi:hypothetical protein